MAKYMRSLDKLLAREDAVYFPAHGPAVEAPRRHVERLIEHRRQRERQILAEVRAGEGRIEAMVARIYAEVDPGLHPAAARSVLAHLLDLEARGIVSRREGRWSIV
jgi:glyoxylase-like metal-dependent hydrolase (beta-lactamase superfamily II)